MIFLDTNCALAQKLNTKYNLRARTSRDRLCKYGLCLSARWCAGEGNAEEIGYYGKQRGGYRSNAVNNC